MHYQESQNLGELDDFWSSESWVSKNSQPVRYPITVDEGSISCGFVGTSRQPKNRGIRKPIIEFSPGSRRRMLKKTTGLYGEVYFLTLTFGRQFPDAFEGKQFLQRFLKRFFRKYPKMLVVWRLEFQKRGAVHFHLILVSAKSLNPTLLKIWCQKFWHSLLKKTDYWQGLATAQYSCNLKVASGKNAARAYITKYAAKGDIDCAEVGRRWGICGDQESCTKKISTRLSDREQRIFFEDVSQILSEEQKWYLENNGFTYLEYWQVTKVGGYLLEYIE